MQSPAMQFFTPAAALAGFAESRTDQSPPWASPAYGERLSALDGYMQSLSQQIGVGSQPFTTYSQTLLQQTSWYTTLA